MERVDLEGFTWLVDEAIGRDRLLSSLSGWGEGNILRRTPNRCVKLVSTHGCSLVVKHFHHAGIRGALKTLVRGTPASREWLALREAKRRGIQTCRPLGLGRQEGILREESLLVMQAVENAVPLADYLCGPKGLDARERWQAVHAAAGLVRRAHDLGFYQRDLHGGNILIQRNDTGVEAYLIDLQRLSIGRSLSPVKRWQNLATLHGGSTEARQTDRLRFLKHYLSFPPALSFDLRGLVTQLEKKGWRHRFKLWRSRQKRCLAENREFVRIRTGTFCGFARREQWENFFVSLLQKHEGLLQLAGAQVIKDSKTTTVAVAGPLEGRFYIKRYNYQNLAYAAKDLFRPARARRTWMAANSLHMRGIPVALPLLYLERRRLGLLRESYVFTEARSGVMVRDVFRGYDKLGYQFQDKRVLLDQLARLVKKMHARGVAHRDLKGTNIIARTLPGGAYDLSIVDFDGIRLGPVPWRRRIKNLARVAEECHRHCCFTRSDRLRFLKAYLGTEEKKWKWVWSRLARLSNPRF